MILGWKVDLAKKVIETVVLNFAMLAVKEVFTEGSKLIKDWRKSKNGEEEESESKPEKKPQGDVEDSAETELEDSDDKNSERDS